MTVADIAFRVTRRAERVSPVDREELSSLIEEYKEMIEDAYHHHSTMIAHGVPKRPALQHAGRFPEPVRILRTGITSFAVLAITGASLFLVNKGLGLASLYAGVLVFLIAAFGYSIRTGQSVVSPRYAVLMIVIVGGLMLVALIGAVEAVFFRT